MARASRRGLLRSVVVAMCLFCAAVVLTGSGVSHQPLRMLQVNLCASGRAGCYTGRSVDQAAAVLRVAAPDVVTLNEVCEGDVRTLERALAAVHRGGVVSAFEAAPDRPSGEATRCRDGQAYGIGLLARLADPGRGHTTYAGAYPMQDPRDPEERVWLCLYATGDFYACTTHLASTNPPVALAQCRHLLDAAIPAMRAPAGYRPTVLGGDLNLRYGAAPDMRSCVPSGYVRLGDGGLQHILATSDLTVGSSESVDMARTTDHPGLLVTFTADRR
jgi:hypothetical protein